MGVDRLAALGREGRGRDVGVTAQTLIGPGIGVPTFAGRAGTVRMTDAVAPFAEFRTVLSWMVAPVSFVSVRR